MKDDYTGRQRFLNVSSKVTRDDLQRVTAQVASGEFFIGDVISYDIATGEVVADAGTGPAAYSNFSTLAYEAGDEALLSIAGTARAVVGRRRIEVPEPPPDPQPWPYEPWPDVIDLELEVSLWDGTNAYYRIDNPTVTTDSLGNYWRPDWGNGIFVTDSDNAYGYGANAKIGWVILEDITNSYGDVNPYAHLAAFDSAGNLLNVDDRRYVRPWCLIRHNGWVWANHTYLDPDTWDWVDPGGTASSDSWPAGSGGSAAAGLDGLFTAQRADPTSSYSRSFSRLAVGTSGLQWDTDHLPFFSFAYPLPYAERVISRGLNTWLITHSAEGGEYWIWNSAFSGGSLHYGWDAISAYSGQVRKLECAALSANGSVLWEVSRTFSTSGSGLYFTKRTASGGTPTSFSLQGFYGAKGLAVDPSGGALFAAGSSIYWVSDNGSQVEVRWQPPAAFDDVIVQGVFAMEVDDSGTSSVLRWGLRWYPDLYTGRAEVAWFEVEL